MPLKQPSETADLSLGFGLALASIDAVVITARGLVAGSALPTVVSQAIEGAAVKLRLAGGTDGERYLITARAVTTGGQTLEREADLAVVDFGFAVPAGAGAFLSPQQLVDRIGLDTATRLTDDIGSGRIGAARLASAIADAEAEVSGYIAGRFQLPLAQPWPLLTSIAAAIAVERLWQARGETSDAVALAAKQARAQLADIAAGRLTAPTGAAAPATDASPAPVLFDPGAGRRFTRAGLDAL
jgi:phage gp36-like protein